MHFLCLHGSMGNVTAFSAQLGPLRQHLEQDNATSFHCVNGLVKSDTPEGFGDFFGPGQHYRWIGREGADEDTINKRIRGSRVIQSPEDTLRSLVHDVTWINHKEIMEYLDETLEQNPDITGILGYSEGACIASTYIIHEEKMHRETGRPRRIKCGIFFTGMPPINPTQGFVLYDDTEDMVDVPTLHVIGSIDPYRAGADALYNVCDPDTAEFFDTGKGHTVPRGGPVIDELGAAIRGIIEQAEAEE
ncbi:hypothetical protein N7471_008668 [Penicillium samsonianum]|uniref:uncharacterized protein n=1 Tax=Penicillium samsonianum TaxID=1882272 RepID=UPI002546899E|nr:uncharacterized protein N7471_008668 [Penicillium samsonianum]KAJ6133453.1 hypothetical protein N7471_008668 [Penicillium samsonianum]